MLCPGGDDADHSTCGDEGNSEVNPVIATTTSVSRSAPNSSLPVNSSLHPYPGSLGSHSGATAATALRTLSVHSTKS